MAKQSTDWNDFLAGNSDEDELEDEGLTGEESEEEGEEQEEQEEDDSPSAKKKKKKTTIIEEEEEETPKTKKKDVKAKGKTKPAAKQEEAEEEEEEEEELEVKVKGKKPLAEAEEEEGDEGPDSAKFFEEVEKITGKNVPVDYGDIDPLTPEGVALREKALKEAYVNDFLTEIEESFPEAFQALQHAY